VPELVRRLVAAQLDVRAVVPAPEQGLEDFFLELTQSSDVDGGRTGAAAASPAGTAGSAGTVGAEGAARAEVER